MPTDATDHIAMTVYLIGGPRDGQTIALPPDIWKTGILTVSQPSTHRPYIDAPMTEVYVPNITHYYQHGHHRNIWLHESVSYQATHAPQE
jgi:hypothetical protein